jgi:glycolate oxidase FAD binding subunit
VSTATTSTRFAAEFRAICGQEHLTEDPVELQGWNILDVTPALAVTPASADEIAGILRVANDHGLSVAPAGGFTQQQTGNLPPQVDVLLSTSRLTEVEHYDAGDLTIGIGAGCTVAQLSAMVAENGLLFAGDPAQPERCTVGGLLATGLYGPLRHGYGGLRDYCIGVRFVTGDGRNAKGGGRVVKNVAGYDMMKLLIGSQGTLGIITSASFKLFPAPRQTWTFAAVFRSAAEAIEFRNRVLHSPLAPICLEIVSPEAPGLLGVSEQLDGGAWSILVRAAGSDAVLDRYRTELGTAISREIESARESELWRALEDFPPIAAERHPRSLLVSMTLPVRDIELVLDKLSAVAESNHFTFAAIGRVGAGHLLASLWQASDVEFSLVSFVNAVSALRNRLPHDVSMAVLRCPLESRHHISAWGPMPTDMESMRAVKMALDPKDILNRGRFLF